jgi:mono/diheme cytochrome c family protein
MRPIYLLSSLLLVAACGGDDEVTGDDDGVAPDAEVTSPDADPTPQPSVARGAYLVTHVLGCGDCHTPRLQDGSPDLTNLLAGVECFIDVDGGDATTGCLHTRNLTNHATGLMSRSDAEIKTMFLDGTRPNGEHLIPIMPYWVFHNLTTVDADSVVLYLRTVTGVDHTVPANDTTAWPAPGAAAAPFDLADLPEATQTSDAITRGAYLASVACIDCHTPLTNEQDPRSIDTTKVLAGGRAFPRDLIGLPPTFPDVIYTMNLTPHATGLETYAAADIVEVLKEGTDMAGDGVCPPMPSGPMGPFAGLTDADAADIAAYIDALPAVDNAIPNGCSIPAQ